jgi:hypothetical protein
MVTRKTRRCITEVKNTYVDVAEAGTSGKIAIDALLTFKTSNPIASSVAVDVTALETSTHPFTVDGHGARAVRDDAVLDCWGGVFIVDS